MSLDEQKGRRNGDHPAGDTIYGMVEGGNWLATAGHIRPHQCGTCGNYAGAEAKDTNLDSQGHPKAGEGIITLGIPIPPYT